ncbi:hypothetical protein ACXOK9_03055 [Streptococcus thermophilus]
MACIGLLLFNGYNRAFRPYLYDKSNYYYKAYHYKVKKIKPQKKIVKDIEIEVLHFGKDDFPDNLSTYKDSHYTDKGIDPMIRMMLVKKELKKEFRTSSMTTILENMVIFGMKDTI